MIGSRASGSALDPPFGSTQVARDEFAMRHVKAVCGGVDVQHLLRGDIKLDQVVAVVARHVGTDMVVGNADDVGDLEVSRQVGAGHQALDQAGVVRVGDVKY